MHARDELGYLAGRDEDRIADLNAAIRDPEARAVITQQRGCGSFRLLHDVAVEALAADPKPRIGYSDIHGRARARGRAAVAATP